MKKYYTIKPPIRAKNKKLVIKSLTTSEIYLILLYQEKWMIKRVIQETHYTFTKSVAMQVLTVIEKVERSGGKRTDYIGVVSKQTISEYEHPKQSRMF